MCGRQCLAQTSHKTAPGFHSPLLQMVGFTHQYFLPWHIAALSLVSIELGNQDRQRAQQVRSGLGKAGAAAAGTAGM